MAGAETTTFQKVKLEDPRGSFAKPPFNKQKPMNMSGSTAKMNPSPDHGEERYQGSGKLQGLNALNPRLQPVGLPFAICDDKVSFDWHDEGTREACD
jgi:hypothetical protein